MIFSIVIVVKYSNYYHYVLSGTVNMIKKCNHHHQHHKIQIINTHLKKRE